MHIKTYIFFFVCLFVFASWGVSPLVYDKALQHDPI